MVKSQNIHKDLPDHKKNLYVNDVVTSPEIELEKNEKYIYKQKEITPTDVSEETRGPPQNVHFVLAITNKRILVRPEKGQKKVEEEFYKEVYLSEIQRMYYGTKPNRKKIKLELKDGQMIELPRCSYKKWQMKQISRFANLEETEWGTRKSKSITKKIVGTIGATGSIILGIGFAIFGLVMAFTVVGICLAMGAFFAAAFLIWGGIVMGEYGFRAKREWEKKTSSKVDSSPSSIPDKQDKQREGESKKSPSTDLPPPPPEKGEEPREKDRKASTQKSNKDTSESKYCKYCGTKININSKFCKECGKKVVSDE